MKHKHADIICQLANNTSLRLWEKTKEGNWKELDNNNVVAWPVLFVNKEFYVGEEPPAKEIQTPFGSYPEPLREAPAKGSALYCASSHGGAYAFGSWRNCEEDRNRLSAGVLHLTEDAAYAQAQVELKRRMAELGWEKS